MTAGVEPREAPAELFDVQVTPFQIAPVDIGNLQLATRGRTQSGSDVEDCIVVEIEPCDGPVRHEVGWLFHDRDGLPGIVELDDAVLARLAHVICEYGCAASTTDGARELRAQVVTVEDVVAENQSYVIVANELTAEDERVSKTDRLVLDDITQRNAPGRTIAQKGAIKRQVIRRRDQKDIA